MCGIIVAVSRDGPFRIDDGVLNTLKARGPDCLQIHASKVNVSGQFVRHLTFASSVLSLRGSTVIPQPVIDENTGSVLCWNGEAWTYDGRPVDGNDAQHIFSQLLEAMELKSSESDDFEVRSRSILKVLTSVAGPYAVVFYDAPFSTLYYARDPLGRRSLMVDLSGIEDSSTTKQSEAVVSSFDVTTDGRGREVMTSGVHYIKLGDVTLRTNTLSWPNVSTPIQKAITTSGEHIPAIPNLSTVDALGRQLSHSVALRVCNIPTYNTTEVLQSRPSRVAILFSGGLDCTLLARLSHDLLPHDEPIDLLNIAFENPRVMRAAALSKKSSAEVMTSPYEVCPDRITGRSSFAELCSVCADRTWRFVAIDIPYAEMLEHKSTIVKLMRPHNTEMDLSIATALYFAARGSGTASVHGSANIQAYTTPARVLLSGLGADELFGGYSRHSAAFLRGGFEDLEKELELDFRRIGTRNLGRDDRVMAHWSREVRYPFLDEQVVEFSLQLPAWEKVGFRSGKSIPKHFEQEAYKEAGNLEELDAAKMILRCLCWTLGMRKVSNERKRAIQFGARTAKMEGGRTKGSTKLAMMTDLYLFDSSPFQILLRCTLEMTGLVDRWQH